MNRQTLRRGNESSSLALLTNTITNSYGSSAYQSQKPVLLNVLNLEIPALTTYDSSFVSVNDAATIRIEIDNTAGAGEVYFTLAFSPTKAASVSYIPIDRMILAGEYYSQYFPTKSDYFSYSIANSNEFDISLNIYSSLSRFSQYETASQLDNLVTRNDIATLNRQANDFEADVALGVFKNYSIPEINGYGLLNIKDHTSLVWDTSQNYLQLSSAETMTLFSLQDTASTREAIINVYGVDYLGRPLQETVFLDASDSTVPIETTETFLRVNKLDFVSGENTNDAQIWCVSSVTNKLQEIIPIGANVSRTAKYAVDWKHRGVLKKIYLSGYVTSKNTTLYVYRDKYYPVRRRELLRRIPVETMATYSEEMNTLINEYEEVYCIAVTGDQAPILRNDINVSLDILLIPI